MKKKSAYKLFPDNCKVDWTKPLNDIYNHIRGLNPYPAAWTTIHNNEQEITAKIYDVSKQFEEHTLKAGTIITTKKELKIAVKDGYLLIKEIKLSGKKKMNTVSLLNGFSFSDTAKAL